MAYSPDPGGIFESDAHRRVQAVVPNPEDDPKTLTELIARLDLDPHVPLGTTQEEEVLGVLEDLEKSDFVVKSDEGYKATDEGWAKLTGPPAEGI